MNTMIRSDVSRWLPHLNGWLVFLFSALAVTAPSGSGYSYAPALLLLLSLAFWPSIIRSPLNLDQQDRIIIAVMAFFFLVHAAEIVYDGQPMRAFDRPSRFILAIPVLCLLLAYPPRPAYFWWGAIVGSSLAGIITIAQKWIFGVDMASAWMMRIQFAALVMVLALVCFAGTGYFYAMRDRPGMFASAAGGVLGMTAAFLSGVRGAWLVMPVAAMVLALAYRKLFPARFWTGVVTALLMIVVILISMPQTGVKDRVIMAVSEVQAYVDTGDVRSASGARLEMWKTAMVLIPEKPWLGWGRNGYVNELARRVESGETPDYMLSFNHAHNEIIDMQLKRGLAGLTALLLLYVIPSVWFIQRARIASDMRVRAAALAGFFLLLVFFFSGLTQVLFAHNSGVTFFAVMMVIAWANMKAMERDPALCPDR
jgi:O-antigen ligase